MEEIQRLLGTRSGFLKAFWDESKRRLREHGVSVHADVYDYLEDICRETFGEPRFPSYEAFRKYRDRQVNK